MDTGRGGRSRHLPNLHKLKQCQRGDGVARLSSTSKNFVASLSHLALFSIQIYMCVCVCVCVCVDIATDLCCILRIWGLESQKSAGQDSRSEMQGSIFVGTQV